MATTMRGSFAGRRAALSRGARSVGGCRAWRAGCGSARLSKPGGLSVARRLPLRRAPSPLRRAPSPLRRLAHQPADVVLEARVRHGRSLHALDGHAAARGEAGYRAEHRHPMVAVGVDGASLDSTAATHDEAVAGRLDLGAEAGEAVDRRPDPVALLDLEL